MAAAGGLAVAEMPSLEEAQAHAEEIVGSAREHLERRGIGVRAHVCTGDPAEALITVATDMHAQMIVVGNRGMTGARRVLGSVPNRVSHRAECAVLIVPTC
jgi:nucleotide-binding universal stress UspA family protein